jgi:CBS domain-containing protein
MNFTASDVMNEDVVTFQRDTTVREAFEIIINKDFSGAPVVNDDNMIIGVVTEKDLLATVSLEASAQGQYDQKIPYIQDVVAINADMSIEELRGFFVEFGFKRFPVVDENRKVIGVVSRRDLVRLISEQLQQMI